MKNYTPKEIEQLRQEEYDKLKKLYEENLKAWNNRDKSFKYQRDFMTTHIIKSGAINIYRDISNSWDSLIKTIDEIKVFEKNNFYITKKNQWRNYEENSTKFITEYTILRKNNIEEMLKALTENNFNHTLAELMFDNNKHKMCKDPDPQMLDLFMNGIIDWEQLVTITHKNNMK